MPSDGVGPWPWSQKATFQSIYCCVTNHLKTLWLKTAISSYFSQSCWSEMGGTRPCSSIDQEMSFGVIHLVAFFWQVSWAEKSKKVWVMCLVPLRPSMWPLHVATLGFLTACELRLSCSSYTPCWFLMREEAAISYCEDLGLKHSEGFFFQILWVKAN